MHDSLTSTNAAGTLQELFALSDEQILEIEPETQDLQAHSAADAADRAHSPQGDFPEEIAVPASRDDRDGNAEAAQHQTQNVAQHPQAATGSGLSEPPRWLAERMADPQAGAEARELWSGVQQSRQEAAAFREVFAKPEDARAAAQRSRLLDDIDRAYFTGDSSQRAQLAASMLRADPAAFREMVFAGLRALEETGKSGATNNFAPRSPNTVGAGLVYAAPRSAPPADSRAADSLVGAQVYPEAFSRRDPAPQLGNTPATEAHLATYATFERAANEDLERTVGGAIERTLDQALPHGNRAENAAMRSRLAATVRQDIEKALQGDRQLGEQVAQVLSARRLDSNARAQIVRLIGDRAQQLVPGTAKRVLGEWTQTTLDSHRGRTNRIESAAARRDVATSSSESRTVSSAANSVRSTENQNRKRDNRSSAQANASHGRKVDYRKFSDEQILDS
jgi:hypothetical protein